MKHSFLIFSFVFIVFAANAQVKATDFYTLLQSLISNENSTPVNNWNIANSASIKWLSAAPKKSGLSFVKNGKAEISFNGVVYKCGAANKPCNWEINLSGKTMSGYSEFEITGYTNDEIDMSLEKLLGKKQYETKLLKTDSLGALSHFYYYELKLPAKNKIWVMTSMAADNSGLLMDIACFFNKKEIEERMVN